MTPPYLLHTLENGLTVILVPMSGVKSLTVFAMVGTGSRFESDQRLGISHFLEHMVFKGTKNYPTARELAGAVDEVGAEFNAFTSKEYTGYYVKCASEYMDLAVDVVSDMLLTARLRPEDLEREKGVIVEEIHMYEDTPMRHIGDVFENLMFAGSGLGREIIGSPETVRSFTDADFRDHLKTWYGLKNVCFVIAGDEQRLQQPDVIEKVKAAFAKLETPRDSQATSEYIKTLTANPISQGKRLLVSYKDTQQAHFIMAFPGIARTNPDRYALSILTTLLGGNMSSRLFTEVREKRGLCYYVRADEDHYHETGVFGASAGVDPKRVDEAVKVVKEQLMLVADSTGPHRITEEEVAKAKSHVLGATVLDFEDSQNVAQLFAGSKLLMDKVETIEEKLDKLRAVTHADVVRIAQQLVKEDDLYFAIIGPYKDEAHFADLLK